MRNNKVFIAPCIRNAAVLDAVCERVESYGFFDRYGDASSVGGGDRLGFVSVAGGGRRLRSFAALLGCSYVYFPCGWHEDRRCRAVLVWSELLGKRMIFEEDSRCR